MTTVFCFPHPKDSVDCAFVLAKIDQMDAWDEERTALQKEYDRISKRWPHHDLNPVMEAELKLLEARIENGHSKIGRFM